MVERTTVPPVKILDKALRVLMLFTTARPEWGVTDVAREVDMPKSTIHRIFRVLEQHGFLMQDRDNRRYRLGLSVLELGRRAHEGMELRSMALPVMEELAQRSGETILLQVVSPEGDRVVCIERVQRQQGLRLILEVGSTAPLHAGCSSRALLAHLPEEDIERVLRGPLRALTARTPTNPKQIRAELARIRHQGYSVSYEETDDGVAGVSVPIRDYMDRVVASLSISGPITRVNEDTMDHFIQLALQAADELGTRLGHLARAPRAVS